ncbi:MAG: hypothetical protein HYV32_03410 [Candidatus Kerfeldbacteria bacterium]|nr:hypothetical protein [Candidatus Kerfeldbacteria bacterium]
MHHKHRLLLFCLVGVIIIIVLFLAKKEINEEPITSDNTTNNANTNAPDGFSDADKRTLLQQYGFWIPAMSSTPGIQSYTEVAPFKNINFAAENAVIIAPLEYGQMMRESYGSELETPFTVDGREGVRIQGKSAKDGSSMEYILLKTANNLYIVLGDAAFLDEVQTKIIFN